jgi:hypothetical protein
MPGPANPGRTPVIVAGLLEEAWLVEIEAEALLPGAGALLPGAEARA